MAEPIFYGLSLNKTLTEGYYYATLLAAHTGKSSGTYAGAAAGSQSCVVTAMVRV